MPRRLFLIGLLTVAGPHPAAGQSLSEEFQKLFTFGDCDVALCLSGVSELIGHGSHYIGSAERSGAAALLFITNAIGTNISNIPIPSTSGGATFEFVNGLPVRSDVSSGPIFGERASTIGRGRVLTGVNATYLNLRSIRGVPLDNLVFNFAHEDVDPPGLGQPLFENDIIQVQTDLDVELFVATAFLTFGLADQVDIGVAVPLVSVSARGTSTANILPIGSGTNAPVHLFDGTPEDPILVSVATADGSAAGIGDITGRLKIKFTQNTPVDFGVIAEVRLPTGNEEDLLGAGELAVRGLGILSARLGDITPHFNAGYTYRRSEAQSSTFTAIAGFDQLLAPWATMAVDLVTEWQTSETDFALGEPIVYGEPFPRRVTSTTIPDRRDDLVNGSVGFKLSPSDAVTVLMNALVPLGNGGVQPSAAWTVGFELNF